MLTKKAICSLQTGEKLAIDYDGKSEESLWKNVAKMYYDSGFVVPNTITVTSEDNKHQALVSIDLDDSLNSKEEIISMRLAYDTFNLDKSVYEKKKLRHVNAEKNIRYRYDINPNNMGPRTISVGAISGVIGKKGYDRLEDGMVLSPYPSQLYWLRYYEKIKAGYEDYTEFLIEEDDENQIENFFKEPTNEETIALSDAQELFKFFAEASKSNLRTSGIEIDFYSNKSPYTRRQITSVRKIYKDMCLTDNVEDFNALIDKLIAIAAPKYEKGKTIKSYHAGKSSDPDKQLKLMKDKLMWADSIISSMEAVVALQQNDSKVKNYETPFGNITIRKQSEEEMKKTIESFGKRIRPEEAEKIVSIYDVNPIDQKEKYEKKLNSLFKVEEILAFHGSPNCNWISIIINGLLLNPDAVICGKSLGNGSYLAYDFGKSAGYGSQSGSYWRGGNSEIAAMGVFRTATGNTYEPEGIIGGDPAKTKELLEMFKKEKYDSLWYHADQDRGVGFLRDEIVVYDEAQTCLDKIILYKA